MTLGHSGSLYFLAFDHRGVFARSVLDTSDEPTPQQEATIIDCKSLIFEGLERSIESGRIAPGRVGVLVDELYGADVARSGKAAGVVVTMPVEMADQELFTFDHGEAFGEHIEAFDPDFAKVLVRYNVGGDPAGNRVQAERLAELSAWLRARDRRFLFELLVFPTDAQLADAGGDVLRYELEARPELIRRAMAELQDAGVEPDVWKLEGIDADEEAARTVEVARRGEGRGRVICTVLGAGAGQDRVDHWLGVAARTEGFEGFAIGRSIWREPLRDYLAGTISRAEAAEQIAKAYERFVDVYEQQAPARA